MCVLCRLADCAIPSLEARRSMADCACAKACFGSCPSQTSERATRRELIFDAAPDPGMYGRGVFPPDILDLSALTSLTRLEFRGYAIKEHDFDDGYWDWSSATSCRVSHDVLLCCQFVSHGKRCGFWQAGVA